MTCAPTRSAFLLPALLLAAANAEAQESATHIEQQPSAMAAGQVGVAQITERSSELIRSGPSSEPARPPAQLSGPDQSARPAAQLTDERRRALAGPQLSQGGTAESPEPLSRPSEGRTGAVARVEGDDRCAPDAAGERPAVCARVIETRAGEFARPDPLTLSPEQRLLVDQRLREGAGSAARLVGMRSADAAATAADPERPEGQAIASVVLDRPEREDPLEAAVDPTGALPDASAALIEALLNNAGATAQPPR